MSTTFHPCTLYQSLLLPPDVREWLRSCRIRSTHSHGPPDRAWVTAVHELVMACVGDWKRARRAAADGVNRPPGRPRTSVGGVAAQE